MRTHLTVLFSDIEGSTAINERLGDERWLEVLRRHNGIVRESLAASRGREVKCWGDAFMAVFADAASGVECAVRVHRELRDWWIDGWDARVAVRIGMHSGDVLRDGDDYIGRNVTLAARVADRARGGEILVTDALRAEAGESFAYGETQRVMLQGLSGQHRVAHVLWKPPVPWRKQPRVRPERPRAREYHRIERRLREDA